MASAENVVKRAKKLYVPKPSEARSMNEVVNKTMSILAEESKRFSAVPMLCGSVAKDTWLPGRNEFDIFLLFDFKISKDELKKKGLYIGKKAARRLNGRWKLAYAEHPYLQVEIPFNKRIYKVDIVPCYNVPSGEKIKSSVDRTPHHVKYVKSKLKEKMNEDIRVLKQFCIASGCYGADMKTLGFSGYLCELLILKYKDFISLLESAAKWMPGTVIDIEGSAKNKAELVERFKSPLIVIDPVDRNRNVAAAVSPESFFEFVKSVKGFLKSPSLAAFESKFKKPLSVREVKKRIVERGTNLFIIKFKKPDILEDILWSQLRRAGKSIEKNFHSNGFRVFRKGYWADGKECILLFEMDVWSVPKIKKHSGPNIFSSKQSREFLNHYKKDRVFIENALWVVETKRKFTNALSFLKSFLHMNELQLKERGMPSHLAKEIHNAKK